MNRSVSLKHLYQCLKNSHANHYIGEPVTQLEHAVLAAQMAERDHPHDPQLIISCLLHDLGHQLAPMDMKNSAGEVLGVINHEYLGANYLRQLGLPAQITQPIANHVKTKRYLCATNPNYRNNLSVASQKTLLLQSGIMTPLEVKKFQRDPYFTQSLAVRKYDDLAKDASQLQQPAEVILNRYFNLILKFDFLKITS